MDQRPMGGTASLLDEASRNWLRPYFITAAGCSLLSAVALPLLATNQGDGVFALVQWGCLVVALVFALAARFSARIAVGTTMLVANWIALVLVCLVVLARGEGIHALELGFFCMLICVIAVVCSVRAAVLMTVSCAAVVLLLARAEQLHWVRGALAVPEAPLGLRVLTLQILIVTSFSCGLLLTRLVASHVDNVRRREQRYRALFEQMPAALLLHRAGRAISANQRARELLDLDDLRQRTDDAPTSQAEQALIGQASSLEGQPTGVETATESLAVPSATGSVRQLTVSAVRVEDRNGPATLSLFLDDTQRAAAELDARQSRVRMAILFAASPHCILLTELGTGGRIVMVNEAFTRISGYASAEVVGRSVAEIGLWADAAALRLFLGSILRDGRVKDLPASFRMKHGEVRQLHLCANSYTLDGVVYLVTYARDVTEREQLRREQQVILGSASLGIALTRDGVIVRANAACASLFGTPQDELVGVSVQSLARDSDDEQAALAQLREVYDVLARGEPVELERELVRADGSTFWCRLHGRAIAVGQPALGEVWVAEDVTEQRQLAQELVLARDAALVSARAKSAFLANISHEIRTPLSGVIGLAKLAQKCAGDTARRRGHLQQLLDSAASLVDIMGGILDLSSIESGKLVLEAVPFDLHAVLRASHSALASVAEARQLEFPLHIAPEVPRIVLGDAVRTRQIVSNYLTNALKFTSRGCIEMRVSTQPAGRIRIDVRDTGVGIAAHALAGLFQPFTQAEESTTRHFGGTGLGLAICRELAELMHGSVGVTSELGRGSTFWAELRLPETALLPELRAHASAVLHLPEPDVIAPPARGEPVAATSIAALGTHAPALAGRRIVVAEDNPVNMIVVRTMLEDLGAQVIEAPDGLAAVAAVDAAAAAGTPADLVLMDLQMPGLDGFGATSELRRRHGADALPIVALTAAALVEERESALRAGMNGFLTKPIDERVFAQTLTELLGRRQLP